MLSKNIIALTYDENYIAFLKEIIKYHVLYYPAHGIAKLVVAGKIRQLSEKQANVYKWCIYNRFKKRCENCGIFIEWKDMYNAVASGNLCEKCFGEATDL